MKKEIMLLLEKNINLSGLLMGAVQELLKPALEKVVKDSSNPLDDILLASIMPVLEKELQKLADEKLKGIFSK